MEMLMVKSEGLPLSTILSSPIVEEKPLTVSCVA